MATDEEIKAHVVAVWARKRPDSPIYDFLLSDAVITNASKGLMRARLQLTKNHMNSKGGIHGATSAAIVDWAGSLVIATWDMSEKTGVSTDIHVSYLSSAKEGDLIEVEARANKVGGSLAYTSVTISKVVDGVAGPIIATGSHTKYVRLPSKTPS